jgi:putative Mg2+ transporter-C (MgtC) family protein
VVAAAIAMIQANWPVVHTADTHVSIARLDMMLPPPGILSSVDFVGASAILRRGEIVHSITTAAMIWLATDIGLCCGACQLHLAAASTAVALTVLRGIKYAEAVVVVMRETPRLDRRRVLGLRLARDNVVRPPCRT